MIWEFSQNTMTVTHKIKRIFVPEKSQVVNVKAEALNFPLSSPNGKSLMRVYIKLLTFVPVSPM
jgi:hypothetical protein